ncbi:MAG: hypothetical protein JWS11_2165 [Cypionkella sp.]|nr:hypothetical protein [Cypionkella sp.]
MKDSWIWQSSSICFPGASSAPLSRFARKPQPGSGSMQGRTYTELPLPALLMAVWRRKPKTKVYVHFPLSRFEGKPLPGNEPRLAVYQL